MMKSWMAGVAGAMFMLALLAMPAAADPAAPDLRNTRYCEILTLTRHRAAFDIEVYNTLGLNLCPAEQWAALDARALARELGVSRVVLNGPRYWTLDGIAAKGATAAGKTVTFGGIAMTQRATLNLKAWQVREGSYRVTAVQRTTAFHFKGGAPVFELVSPAGDVYMMQSYAQIVDRKLSFDDLAGLGSRLKLPKGWSFRTRTLPADYDLVADGTAYVIQDDLDNTYQRKPK